jgi:hypothetical protein
MRSSTISVRWSIRIVWLVCVRATAAASIAFLLSTCLDIVRATNDVGETANNVSALNLALSLALLVLAVVLLITAAFAGPVLSAV